MLRVCNRYMYTPEQLLAALITIYNVQPSCSDYADMLVRMDDLSLIVRIFHASQAKTHANAIQHTSRRYNHTDYLRTHQSDTHSCGLMSSPSNNPSTYFILRLPLWARNESAARPNPTSHTTTASPFSRTTERVTGMRIGSSYRG